MARRSSIGPTTTVFIFWWIVTAILAPSWPWESMKHVAIVIVISMILGTVAVVTAVAVIRSGYRTVVAPTELRGLRCSIGEVPLPMPAPDRAEALPAISPVTMPGIPADFVDDWLDEYAGEFPQHAALFKALLLVLNHRPELPATHVSGGHGGRTLLQHSLLAAWVISEISKDWRYDGLRDRTGKKVVVPLRDPDYRFNAHDPMVAILGLAHDIGKIESYIYDEKGDVVGIRSEHDLTGSRMLGRMAETWDIPRADRDAMLLAIAHYHHPVELPLDHDARRAVARDDRTIALMELLIKADFCVTSVETRGVMPTEEEYNALDAVRTVSAEQLYEEFVSLIHEAHRINSGNIKYSIGQISPGQDGNGALLYLHEESLRINMLRRMGLQSSPNLGNGRYQITVDLLNVLHGRGLLYTVHENLDYSAGNAMWVCDIIGSKNQKVSNWPCVIAMKIEQFEKLQQLGFYSSSVKIVRNRFGAHMGRQVKGGPGDTVVLGGLGSDNDIPNDPTPRKAKKKAGGASKQERPINEQPPAIQAQPAAGAAQSDRPDSGPEMVDEASRLNDEATPPAENDAQDSTHISTDTSPDTDQLLPDLPKSVDAHLPSINTPSDTDSAVQFKRVAEEPATIIEATAPSTDSDAVLPEHDPAFQPSEIVDALMLAVNMGKNGRLKCHKGTHNNYVFKLDVLMAPESPLTVILSAPGAIEYLSSGELHGVTVVKIKQTTVVSLTPPISAV